MAAADTMGQETHFAQVQEMNVWYNPALKINKETLLHINIRSVNYPNIINYTSKAITLDLVLVQAEKHEVDNTGFANLSLGINADNSGDKTLNASSGMLALSYALPLNYDNTYIAIGFQGAYVSNRIGLDDYRLFPNQFDKYGAIGSAILSDPYQSGNTYQYFTAGAGLAVFHSGEKRQWYIGASIRRLNQPASIKSYSPDFRLPVNNGIQGGYTTAINDKDVIGGYGNFSWQSGAHEHVIGALFTRNIIDSLNLSVSLGVGWRLGDAILPNIAFTIGDHRLAFCYEFNTSGGSNNYYRRAFEFSYRLNL